MPRDSILYLAFVAAAAAIALAERLHTARNETRLLAAGGREVAPWVFRLMVPVYSGLFITAPVEHLLLARRPPAILVVAMVLLYAAAKGLKLSVARHLGEAWTMKVVLPPRPRIVTSGPYRHLRHPNYVAVMAEVLALPLAGGAWVSATVGGILFALILAWRVRTEEEALLAHPEYALLMAGKGRFLPGGSKP
ncbi:MAG TPA: isoprenylcysteine carboxylmethyltransferase family protein [Candidatus Polarisedimenticolia bacterium]|nr:isoprenylcysteine carboxylmethyltransferase family protein [Candidatus Polarisedimenticolia bacterium]